MSQFFLLCICEIDEWGDTPPPKKIQLIFRHLRYVSNVIHSAEKTISYWGVSIHHRALFFLSEFWASSAVAGMRHTTARMSLLILERVSEMVTYVSERVTSASAGDGLILNLGPWLTHQRLRSPSRALRGRAFPLELCAWPRQRCPPQQARTEDAQERKERPAQARPSSTCVWGELLLEGKAWGARAADGVLLGAVGTWNVTASLAPQPAVCSLRKSVVLMVQRWCSHDKRKHCGFLVTWK